MAFLLRFSLWDLFSRNVCWYLHKYQHICVYCQNKKKKEKKDCSKNCKNCTLTDKRINWVRSQLVWSVCHLRWCSMNVNSVPCVLNLTAQLFKETEQFVNIFSSPLQVCRCVLQQDTVQQWNNLLLSENVPLSTQFTTKKQKLALLY